MNLAVLGAGNVRCSVPVFASVATYFGERPLNIRLYDADTERLELFDLFARVACRSNKNPHQIQCTLDPSEALENADRVILQVDENCAVKEAKANGQQVLESEDARISATLERLLMDFRSDAGIISLQNKGVIIPLDFYYRLDWPGDIDVDARRAVPHQVLRWIRGEEYLFELLTTYEKSPLKAWLDDVSTAIVVSEA